MLLFFHYCIIARAPLVPRSFAGEFGAGALERLNEMADEIRAEAAPQGESVSPPAAPKDMITRLRGVLHGPLLIGVIAALVAIGLSLYGMLTNPNATPLTLRSFALVVLFAGGAWGLIAWAIATAAVEAGKD